MLIMFFVIGGGIITGIAIFVEIGKHRPVRSATNADFYIDAGETQMTDKNDTFLRSKSTRVKVASSNVKK